MAREDFMREEQTIAELHFHLIIDSIENSFEIPLAVARLRHEGAVYRQAELIGIAEMFYERANNLEHQFLELAP